MNYNFNSQPHEEADVYIPRKNWNSYDISTHSLTKRLTHHKGILVQLRNISTHSLTKRLTISNALKLIEEGISTHSLTKRLTKGDWSGVHIRFISTHSLTKRLTISSLMVFFIPSGFQLTASRRGWRQYLPSGVLSGLHFNSQPHEEADNGGHTMGAHTSNFNSQPHEEADD